MFFRKIISLLLITCGCCGSHALYAGGKMTGYRELDLDFTCKGYNLSGKLIVPESYTGKLPVIVFVHGSGPEDYSSSDNYRYLWEAFTRTGFACYSWDRPGVGKSQGKWYRCSVEDRADEVISAVNKLKASDIADSSKIGFWGISQAGWVMPLAAKETGPAFIITVSSPVTTAFDQELYRVRSEMQADGFSETDIDHALAYNSRLKALIQAGKPYDSFAVLQQEIAGTKWVDHVIGGSAIVYDYLSIVFKNDNAPDLSSLKCPVLAIWGENDLVVPAKKSFEAYREALKRAGNSKLSAWIIPNADHTLTFNRSGKRAETIARREKYKDSPKEIFAPGYVTLMTGWLKNLSR